jgi:hypothetical protein
MDDGSRRPMASQKSSTNFSTRLKDIAAQYVGERPAKLEDSPWIITTDLALFVGYSALPATSYSDISEIILILLAVLLCILRTRQLMK